MFYFPSLSIRADGLTENNGSIDKLVMSIEDRVEDINHKLEILEISLKIYE